MGPTHQRVPDFWGLLGLDNTSRDHEEQRQEENVAHLGLEHDVEGREGVSVYAAGWMTMSHPGVGAPEGGGGSAPEGAGGPPPRAATAWSGVAMLPPHVQPRARQDFFARLRM